MSSHSTQHFEIAADEDRDLEVTVDDGATPAVAVNITGAAITWTLRTNPASATALVIKTVGSGITITDAAAGKFTIALVAADVALLSGTYFHKGIVTLGAKPTRTISGHALIHK